jgi:hypothetical protein
MFEVVFGVVAAAAILGIGGAMTAVFFNGNRVVDRIMFPESIPLWGTRCRKMPSSWRGGPASIAKMNSAILSVLNEAGFGAPGMSISALNGIRIIWVQATPGGSPGGTLRSVVDPWGRSVGGEPMWVGGWTEGNVVSIVYLDGDGIEDTQYFHEAMHVIFNGTFRDFDYGHEDEIWKTLHDKIRQVFKEG